MIGVFVTFRYRGDGFDERTLQKIAETARARFEGMPGLLSKAFTINSAKQEATNFYIWDSADAAKGFFTDALLEHITTLYGVRPAVEFVQLAALVENARAVPENAARGPAGRGSSPAAALTEAASFANPAPK